MILVFIFPSINILLLIIFKVYITCIVHDLSVLGVAWNIQVIGSLQLH